MPRTQRPRDHDVKQIGARLIEALSDHFGLTLTQAVDHLGYANATTLHKIRSGQALPDPGRLARFARHQSLNPLQTLNLHWILTGQGQPMIDRAPTRGTGPRVAVEDVDIINGLARLAPDVKQAVRVLVLANSAKTKRGGR